MATFTDLTEKIEQLEAFEEKAGLRLAALFAGLLTHVEKDLFIHGEIVGENAIPVEKGFVVNVSVHDSSGRVVGVGAWRKGPNQFRGFTTFSVRIFALPSSNLSRIRVYPTTLIR